MIMIWYECNRRTKNVCWQRNDWDQMQKWRTSPLLKKLRGAPAPPSVSDAYGHHLWYSLLVSHQNLALVQLPFSPTQKAPLIAFIHTFTSVSLVCCLHWEEIKSIINSRLPPYDKKLPKTGSRRNITTTCTAVQAVPSLATHVLCTCFAEICSGV